jgi:hypothetical protein
MKITVDNKNVILPDFLIVGTSRSGTTSLYFYLREHPEVFLPEEKEPNFFDYPETLAFVDYVNLFNLANNDQIIGEATSTYLYNYKKSIDNIKSIYGSEYRKLKIIAILRNPIDRAWSYYLLSRRRGYTKNFFETVYQFQKKEKRGTYHDFISSGMYYKQVEAFYKHFLFIKIFLFEELINNPNKVLKEIYDFLDLTIIDFFPNDLNSAYNASGEPKRSIYIPIYNFLFRDYTLKNFLKHFFPFDFRQKIKTKMANRIIRKTYMSDDVREYLVSIFKDDLNLLIELFDEEEQKQIINKWIESK